MYLKGKEITPEERKIVLKVTNEGRTLWEIGKIVGGTYSSIFRYSFPSLISLYLKMYLEGKEITTEERKSVLKVTNEDRTLWEIGKIVGGTYSSIFRYSFLSVFSLYLKMYLEGKEITTEERKSVLKVTNEGRTLWEIGKIVG
ncbi:hypothetical protein AVEN_28691-1 [Araneus ventricosus]|uniref:Uncharacterized protein n=1 Tax=Araneus ventricosus TaxID=182803 RepID=A0A4Y2I314_ARAVE|nr:hypothetical protein AVEN_28691-1 [Araneus ventricosus]